MLDPKLKNLILSSSLDGLINQVELSRVQARLFN